MIPMSGRKVGFLERVIEGEPGEDPLLLKGPEEDEVCRWPRLSGQKKKRLHEMAHPHAENAELLGASPGPSTMPLSTVPEEPPSTTLLEMQRGEQGNGANNDLTMDYGDDTFDGGAFGAMDGWASDNSDNEGDDSRIGDDTFIHLKGRRQSPASPVTSLCGIRFDRHSPISRFASPASRRSVSPLHPTDDNPTLEDPTAPPTRRREVRTIISPPLASPDQVRPLDVDVVQPSPIEPDVLGNDAVQPIDEEVEDVSQGEDRGEPRVAAETLLPTIEVEMGIDQGGEPEMGAEEEMALGISAEDEAMDEGADARDDVSLATDSDTDNADDRSVDVNLLPPTSPEIEGDRSDTTEDQMAAQVEQVHVEEPASHSPQHPSMNASEDESIDESEQLPATGPHSPPGSPPFGIRPALTPLRSPNGLVTQSPSAGVESAVLAHADPEQSTLQEFGVGAAPTPVESSGLDQMVEDVDLMEGFDAPSGSDRSTGDAESEADVTAEGLPGDWDISMDSMDQPPDGQSSNVVDPTRLLSDTETLDSAPKETVALITENDLLVESPSLNSPSVSTENETLHVRGTLTSEVQPAPPRKSSRVVLRVVDKGRVFKSEEGVSIAAPTDGQIEAALEQAVRVATATSTDELEPATPDHTEATHQADVPESVDPLQPEEVARQDEPIPSLAPPEKVCGDAPEYSTSTSPSDLAFHQNASEDDATPPPPTPETFTPSAQAKQSTRTTAPEPPRAVLVDSLLKRKANGPSRLSQMIIASPPSPRVISQSSKSVSPIRAPQPEASSVAGPSTWRSPLRVSRSRQSLAEELATATDGSSMDFDESFTSVVEVSSLDPRAAARAAAILKMVRESQS